MPLTNQEMKDRMILLYNEANKGHVDIFDELLAPNFISHGGAGLQDLHGPQALKQSYISFLSAFPDLWFRVDDLIAEGHECVARGTWCGTHKGNFMGMASPTGKLITWTGMAIFRFTDPGLIDARWQEWDGVGLMQQLGVIPTPPDAGVKPAAPQPPTDVGGWVTTSEENKALFRRFIEEVWNQGHLEVADELFHPGATSPSAAQLPPGPAGTKIIATLFRNAFPDFHMTVEDLVAEGDKVVARFTETGTHKGEFLNIPATGKQVKFGEIGILRIAGGKVVESWYEVDMLGLLNQLGVGGSTPSQGG
jgi:predicted ester cyclase